MRYEILCILTITYILYIITINLKFSNIKINIKIFLLNIIIDINFWIVDYMLIHQLPHSSYNTIYIIFE